MADTKTLPDAFLDELRDAYDAEKQLTKALPKMAKAATALDLRAAFESHLKETQGHVTRLEKVFGTLDERVRGKHCDGIAGIIEEGKSTMEEDFDDLAMDACLIAGGQRAEHYEMAADAKLSSLAEDGINQEAADAAIPEDEQDGDENETSAPKSRPKTAIAMKAARRSMNTRIQDPNTNHGASFLMGLVAGSAIGAGLAFYFAPRLTPNFVKA